MRQPLVAGNWKMNGSRASVRALVGDITARIHEVAGTEVAVCPPFVFIQEVGDLLGTPRIALGGQDVSDRDTGAFTGEVSAAMLRDYNCRYVIVGHSERRRLYGDTDAAVAAKFAAAQRAGLIPILCVGETLSERTTGDPEAVVRRQLGSVLEQVSAAAFSEAVVAYEPVWAIGTGQNATPDQAQSMHASVRRFVAAADVQVAEKLRVLYGGSVTAANAADLFACEDIDGGLIGGASLDAQQFLAICGAAARRAGNNT